MSYLAADLEQANVDYKVCDLNLDLIRFVERLDGQVATSTSTAAAYLEQWRATNDAFQRSRYQFHGFTMKPYELRQESDPGDLLTMVKSACDPHGPFAAWLDGSSAAQSIISDNPDWVGISVSFLGQLPPAVAIASWIHRRSVSITRIAGGALFRDIHGALGPNSPLWEVFDGIVDGAGEGALTSLTRDDRRILRPRAAKSQGPGWLWSAPWDPRSPPEPWFDRFPLSDYRAAQVVLPYRVFPSCGWGRCTFCADAKYCDHKPAEDGDPIRVAHKLRTLAERHHAAGFVFLDAALPATFMEALAQELSSTRGVRLLWGANARFEASLSDPGLARTLHAGGCRLLRLGLESASPRVLRIMRKGISVDTASAVLKATHSAGLVTHLYLMRGFPGETAEDRCSTLRFLDEHAEQIEMFSMSDFRAYEGAPISLELADTKASQHTSSKENGCQARSGKEDDWVDEEDLICRFLTRKGGTRCFPTTADTILLGNEWRLDYAAPRKRDVAKPTQADRAVQAGAE